MKTVKIRKETRRELTKIKGKITARTGKETTFDEAIMGLIKIAEGTEGFKRRGLLKVEFHREP
mgnify:CR=1 FL=1